MNEKGNSPHDDLLQLNNGSTQNDNAVQEYELTGIPVVALSMDAMPMEKEDQNESLGVDSDHVRTVDLETQPYEDYPINDGVGLSLPSPEEIRSEVMAQRSRTPAFSGRGMGMGMLLLFFFVLVVVIIVSVGVAVGVSNRNDGNDDSRLSILGGGGGGSGGGRTGAPPRPTSPQSTFESVRDYLMEQAISGEDDFDNEQSPQTKAATWLARDDPLYYKTPALSINFYDDDYAYDFVQRYIMALVFFATGGPADWSYHNNFLSVRATCDWHVMRQSVNSQQLIPFGLLCNSENKIDGLYLCTFRYHKFRASASMSCWQKVFGMFWRITHRGKHSAD